MPGYYHEVLNDFGSAQALQEIRNWISGRV
jgi:alpha-beta hydrolase superfamily lysophospholipase